MHVGGCIKCIGVNNIFIYSGIHSNEGKFDNYSHKYSVFILFGSGHYNQLEC